MMYEVCDTTDDERYYPLGLFETLEAAESAIAEFDVHGTAISEHAEDYEEISVYERPFGWTDHGKRVLKIARENFYDEANDEYRWRRVELSPAA